MRPRGWGLGWASRLCGGGKGEGGKWAVGPENPGRAAASHLRYGQLLTPQLLPPLGSSPGCQANASGPSSELGGNHGFFDASFPISESHGPPASQL